MKKLLSKILLIVVVLVVVILFFASSIIKSYIQKNSEEILGRKIQIDKLHINYLKVSIYITDFVLYEENKADTFVSFSQMYINAQPWKIFMNEYALDEFLLDGLYVRIEQEGDQFNFDDIIPNSDSIETDTTILVKEEPARFSFKNISIQNSNFDYLDKEIDNLITLHNLNLRLPLLAWNNEQSEVGVEFRVGKKGNLRIKADINNEDSTYAVQTQIDSLDVSPFSIYTLPYINTSGIQGYFNSNITVKGSMVDFLNVVVSGHAGIYDFILPDNNGVNVFKAKKFYIDFDSLDIKNKYYGVNSVNLESPQLWVETSSETSNIVQLFAPLMVNDTSVLTDSVEVQESDSVPVYYFVDSIVINSGELNFTDASLNRLFRYQVSNFNLKIDSIKEDATKVPANINMILNNKGTFNGNASLDMVNPDNFNFKGSINTLELLSFSPYSEYYIAHPIVQGDFNYQIEIAMTSNKLYNNNSIKINELEFGEKTKDTSALKTPIRLALYILKDKNDNIAFDIPVSGNPSDPDFSMSKIVWKTFSNFIVKTATEPFSALARLVGTDPESIQQLNFGLTQDTLSTDQQNTLIKLGEILNKKPEFKFTLTQETPMESEKSKLALKQVILDYLYKTNNAVTTADSNLLSLKWSLFNKNETAFMNYVDKTYGVTDSKSLVEKCIKIKGENNIDQEFHELLEHRNNIIREYLSNQLSVADANFVIQTADIVNMSAQNDMPIYRIEVSMK